MSLKVKNKAGFTLIEVITIFFIVTMALVGILALIVQSLSSQTYNKNNLVAYQLAQEGIELIRNFRDSSWLASQAWNAKFSQSGLYYVDYRDTLPHLTEDSRYGDLKQDAAGYYYHDLNSFYPSSGFNRLIRISMIDPKSATVRAQIVWTDHGRPYTYNLETILYDWR